MSGQVPSDHASDSSEGWWTRDHVLVIVLAAATALLLLLCWLLVQPFLGPIAWALALAIVAHPLHDWIARRVANPSLAAGLAAFAVAVVIIAPAIFVGHNMVQEAAGGVKTIQAGLEGGKWREQLARSPLGGAISAIEQQVNLGDQLQGMTAELGKRISTVVTGSVWAIVELLLTLFVLFFLFRDRRKALGRLRSLVPLSDREADEVFKRVADTIYATIYGTLVVAAVQGTLGGLMFWWLGLPAPILWGAVMALLAIVPVLGAFVIWVPAAIFLAASGQWAKAAILTGWGGIVIALVDNLLYPILVGKRLRLHTVPVFFAIVGGLALFGAAGLILGPVVLALTDAILDIWRRRTAHGRPADAAAT
ncbi:MAG: AI-2E family transporter [Verrucomicrobiota bacterium]|nr:AI-2E family transporter [Verrucomicrobiota bacterium]